MKTNKVEYFARCKDIARMGPYKSDVEAWAALKHVDAGNPAEGATVWPEKKAKRATKRLDDANDAIWDSGVVSYIDEDEVEHQIECHANSLPYRYRKLASVLRKVLEITNYRPDPG